MKFHFVFPYPLYASGSGILIENLARYLAAENHQVCLYTVEPSPRKPENNIYWSGLIFSKDFPLDFIPTYTRIAAPSRTFGEMTNQEYMCYRDCLRKHYQEVMKVEPNDIVIVSHLWTHALILKEAGIKVDGIMVHGTDLLAGEKYPEFSCEIKESIRWASSLIVNSTMIEEQVNRLCCEEQVKIIKIFPGIDTHLFRMRENILPSRSPLVLHIPGKFVPFKGTERLIRAIPFYEKSPLGIKTLILGTGAFYPALDKAWKETTTKRVRMVEAWLSRKKIARLLNRARLLVVTSQSEPFGMIAAEALSCGLPVVGSASGGLLDIIGDGDGLLVDTENAENLSTSILSLLDEPHSFEERKKMSDRAAKRFSLKNCFKNWIRWAAEVVPS